ncbi:uncharacterized protein LOC125825352 [Solanum verrucosum]|uniref:uncharacterized protein LOC125825352 n=1 Tax=Solanum verrucosum TaxID=315347 RepID=UPI0020D04C0C|nr:uncharacterized protein LOC125825352 [Solanum verrucosum]
MVLVLLSKPNDVLGQTCIVPVRTKNGQIRVCVDFKDLNNACPKDEFPFPIPELMIDAITGYEAMSFMDGSSGYNQIRMAPKNKELTAFHTPKGWYAFGVTSGKFLGFIVRHRGIELDQAKVDALSKMLEPRNIHELKSLQGKLAYLRRFISNLVGRCQPFGHLMKKGAPFNWDETYSDAFKSIKSYLAKPPILAAPIPEKPLILYIAAQERSVRALLAQENSEGKENSIYYLSRTMTPNELNYLPIEKLCLALIFSIQKMKHYFQAHVFEIVYILQKAVKGQALADFLADHPIPDDWESTDELPNEDAMLIEVQPPWKMYFDGAAHRGGAGVGVVFITSQEEILPFSFTLKQCCSNNVVEYQALILGIEMVVDMKQLNLQVFGDSQLVINQLLGSYEVKKPKLHPYHDYAQKSIGCLGDVIL